MHARDAVCLLGLGQPGYTTLMRCTIGNGDIGVGRSFSRDFHDILHRILAIPDGYIRQVHQLSVCPRCSEGSQGSAQSGDDEDNGGEN